MWWLVGVVGVIVLVATYLTWTASRVDRLHTRAATSARALDAHLVRRAAAAAVLAEEAAIPDLYAAARSALDADPDEREAAENDLTKRLRQLALPAGAAGATGPATGVTGPAAGVTGPAAGASGAAAENVVAASRRVGLARQVHNDLVRDALGVRRQRLVRLLGLARRHPSPAYFDVDDPTLDGVATGPAVGRSPG